MVEKVYPKDGMIQEFNYHTHTYRCGHANGTDEEYVQAAIEAGYKILGFADHGPYKGLPFPKSRMDWEELDEYVESLTYLKEKYKDQIEIHIGLETEYYPDHHHKKEELLEKVVANSPQDMQSYTLQLFREVMNLSKEHFKYNK